MKNAVIYARYSSAGQREQSIEDQVADCKKFAEEKGYNVIKVYSDKARSGRTDQRMNFQKMLKDSDDRRFEIVIVWKIDRFGRNREEMAFNKYRLKKNGVKVISAMEYISEDPVGALTESLLEGMAEFYSLNLAENVKRGMGSNAEKAKCNGPLPLGFKNENGTIVEDKETSGIVKLVFDLFLEGYEVKEILNYLKEKGIRRPNGKEIFRHTLDTMLRNERYTGTYIYKDTVIPNAIPVIIDPQKFYKVQNILNTKGYRKVGEYDPYIFKGKLFCGECGEIYTPETGTGKSKKTYYYYKCRTQKFNLDKECSNQTLRKKEFEDEVLQIIFEEILKDDIIEDLADEIVKKYKSRTNELVEELEQQKTEIEKKLNNLILVIEKGSTSVIVIDEINKLEEQLRIVNNNLRAEKVKNPTLTKTAICWGLKNFKVEYIKNAHDKLNLVNNLIDSIVFKNGYVTINLNFNFKKENNRVVCTPKCSSNSQMAHQEEIVLNTLVINNDYTFSYSYECTAYSVNYANMKKSTTV